MIYILDAGPMIALLAGEAGSDIAEDVLTEPGSSCHAHVFNLMEVYYIFYRRGGVTAAEDALQDLLDAGIRSHDDVDPMFWKEAAMLKATHPIALPDAFCIALARRLGGTAVTSDHNEFDPLVPLNLCPIRFIR